MMKNKAPAENLIQQALYSFKFDELCLHFKRQLF